MTWTLATTRSQRVRKPSDTKLRTFSQEGGGILATRDDTWRGGLGWRKGAWQQGVWPVGGRTWPMQGWDLVSQGMFPIFRGEVGWDEGDGVAQNCYFHFRTFDRENGTIAHLLA